MIIAHKTIKRFYIEGQIHDEATIPRLKQQYVRLLNDKMIGQGYTIRLDLDPEFTISYNGKTFEFGLSVYGVYVGRKQAKCIEGVYGMRVVEKSTPKSISREFSQPVAST